MSIFSVVIAGLCHHWRIHAAVAMGVAAATAVLTGALLIGDSVRGSLRHLVLDRLGKIDEMLVTDRFFREEMAAELAENRHMGATRSLSVPAIVFPSAMLQSEGPNGRRMAAGVLVLGSDAEFWELDNSAQRVKKSPGRGEIIINAPLAEELNSKVGDTLIVRFG